MADEEDAEVSREVGRRSTLRKAFPSLTKTDLPEEELEGEGEKSYPGFMLETRKKIKRFFGGQAGTTAADQGKALRKKKPSSEGE